MAERGLAELSGLQGLDRFLQWDLVTQNPWGVPAVAQVGARLLPAEGLVWTSTTVGYAAKVRNIRSHPRVALLRSCPGRAAVLVRGEATLVAGDGTDNLNRLFELMSRSGEVRPLFELTARDPLWGHLYRAYWRRILIRIRVVEVGVESPQGWRVERLRAWRSQALREQPPRGRPSPARPLGGHSDLAGRQMLADGVPALLALPDPAGSAPWAYPVRVRVSSGGAIRLRADAGVPTSPAPRAALAVRVLDDSLELARAAAWTGRLEEGEGWREFLPRSVYGFGKPPGLLPDLAAGLAASLMDPGPESPEQVTPPDVGRSGRALLGRGSQPLSLPAQAWEALEQIFVRLNAAAPLYAGLVPALPDPHQRGQLAYLARRAELERDWAQALLLRGGRRVGPLALLRGAAALRPPWPDPVGVARRQDHSLERWRSRLRSLLPDDLRSGLAPPLVAAARAPVSRGSVLAGPALAVATAAAAALDRLAGRRV